MAAQIKQAIRLEAKAGGGTVYYLIRNTTDYAEARDLLLATAPAFFNSVPQSNYSLDIDTWNIWNARVEYQVPSVTPPGEKSGTVYTSFGTAGGTVHITQSIKTTGAYCLPCLNSTPSRYVWTNPGGGLTWTLATGGAGTLEAGCTETAPNPSTDPGKTEGETRYATITPRSEGDPFYVAPPKPPFTGGAIGVTKDGIEGCDIDAGEFVFTKRVYLDSVSDAQVQALNLATDTVNDDTWRGFSRGEVRFKGCTGGEQGRQNVELTLNFVASPNLTGITIGGITGISKLGHEYLWTYYQDFEDPNAKKIIKRPIYVYTEQVYRFGDFAIFDELLGA